MFEVSSHQSYYKYHQARDEYLMQSNSEMVMHWSLAQSFLIVFCGFFQVYFIKRLFTSNVSKALRP
jgi:hypothetical protein